MSRLQLGRAVAEEFEIKSLDLDGETISLSGEFRCGTFAEQTALRDRFVGYGPHNPDEEVVPFSIDADETLSGYVSVLRARAGSLSNAPTLAHDDDVPLGKQPLTLELVKVASTQFEITCDGADRDTAHSITPWSWVGLPLADDVLAGPTALNASLSLGTADRAGEDGDVEFVTAASGSKEDLYDDTVLYSVASDDFYGASVVLEVTDDQPLWDNFLRVDDHLPVAGEVAPTGQTWHGNAISPIGSTTLVPASMPEMDLGELLMETSNTAGYSWPDEFPFDPEEFEIEYVLTSGTTDGASGAFIVSSEYDDTDPGPIALTSVHLTHNRVGVQMFWNDGGIDPSPVTHTYASPLTADGSTRHRLKMRIDRDTNTVTVTDPDGTETDFTSPKASRLWGRTVLVEQINPAATHATDRFVRYKSVRVDDGRRWRTIVGRSMPDRPDGWRLRNTLFEISPDAAGFAANSVPNLAYPWFLTRTYNAGRRDRKTIALEDPGSSARRVSVSCLRNSPEAATVQVIVDTRTMTFTLRRGAWWVEGHISATISQSLGMQVAPTSVAGVDGEDGTDVTGGLDAAADDVRGNKYRLRSPNAITTSTGAGIVELDGNGTEFWYGFGLDVHPDFTPYYFAAVDHLQRLI